MHNFDNKTANINTKTCILSAVLTATDQQPQKSLKINLDTTLRFLDPDCLLQCKMSAIWRRFPLIIAFYILNVRHISTSGSFDLLT